MCAPLQRGLMGDAAVGFHSGVGKVMLWERETLDPCGAGSREFASASGMLAFSTGNEARFLQRRGGGRGGRERVRDRTALHA